jgi:hypothetical protein
MTTSSQHRSSQLLRTLPSPLVTLLLQQQLQHVHQAQVKQAAAGLPVRLRLLGHLR